MFCLEVIGILADARLVVHVDGLLDWLDSVAVAAEMEDVLIT